MELEYKSFINRPQGFREFSLEELDNPELLKSLYEVGDYLPNGMKVIANSGKIFTLTWMLMGLNNFATKLIMDENSYPMCLPRFRRFSTRAGQDFRASVCRRGMAGG